MIVPDLSSEARCELEAACDRAEVVLVALVTPTTLPSDRARIGHAARGFVYALSASGTTGERAALAGDVAAQIRRAKAHSSAPVALGFGISTPAHAAQAAKSADPAAAAGEQVALFSAALAPHRPVAERKGTRHRAGPLAVLSVTSA